jgi:glycosyltransferase involved in cell wall biosynthesis
VPHGHYRDVYANTVTRPEAREVLGLPAGAAVCLFIGQVRPYKGVVDLVRAFRQTSDPDAVLVIAGRPVSSELADAVSRAATGDERVRVHLGLVAVDDIQRFLNAADLVVLPYVESLNSGAALLALSFDRRVLAPATGAFAELAGALGDRWVTTYGGALDAGTLTSALAATRELPPERAPLDSFGWGNIGRTTCEFYRSLMVTGVSPST